MVGVSLLGNSAIYVQVIYETGIPVIEQAGHLPLAQIPASMEGLTDPKVRIEISRILQTISKRIHRRDPLYRIVIPSDWLHFYMIPVESSMTTEEKQSFLEWETSQRLGEFASHMTTRFYALEETDGIGNVLAVLFPSNLLTIFTEAAQSAAIRLQSIEPDIFASWNCVSLNPDTQYLLKFTSHSICVSQYEKRRFSGFGLFSYAKSKGVIKYLRGSVDNARAKNFQITLKRLLQGALPDNALVWMYGNPLPTQMRTLTERQKDCRLISPFSGWNAEVRQMEHDEYPACTYTEAVGTIRI